MLLAKLGGCEHIYINNRETDLQQLSKAIGKTLSSYTQAINIQNKTIGTLFQKKTKAKFLTDLSIEASEFPITEYLVNCFHYIHRNPTKAKLVGNPAHWPYSSWLDYYGHRDGTLCNKQKFIELVGPEKLEPGVANDFSFNNTILDRIW